MATVTFSHLGSTYTIGPGVTHHWVWNNAPDERVWHFSVDPHLPLYLAYPGAIARVEVTKVENRHRRHSNSWEREIHFWVKNTGDIQTDYLIHMSTVRA